MAANKAQIDEVCELVANGQTLRQIGAHFGVNAGTIIKWIGETEEYSQQYTRARDSASDLFELEIIEAAMSCGPETASADRVKIDALKWVAARRSPKKYGEKVQTEHSGSVNFGELTEEDIERRIKTLISG
jgi:hypothetical protein